MLLWPVSNKFLPGYWRLVSQFLGNLYGFMTEFHIIKLIMAENKVIILFYDLFMGFLA